MAKALTKDIIVIAKSVEVKYKKRKFEHLLIMAFYPFWELYKDFAIIRASNTWLYYSMIFLAFHPYFIFLPCVYYLKCFFIISFFNVSISG